MGYKGYVNSKEGLLLSTYKGKVVQLYYLASAADTHLCPSYYDNPEALIQVGLSDGSLPIAIICPQKSPAAGERIEISAETMVEPKAGFTWKVSAGKIMTGQGTSVILVDTTGLAGQTIVATASFRGAVAACEVKISPK